MNVTPDSFSDGGMLSSVDAAVRYAMSCVDAGADMLDIGGESTRPGAVRVTEQDQIARVVPVIRGIRALSGSVPISVDTTLSGVARAALDAGADAINDVSAATEDTGMLSLAAEAGCGLVLMHRLVPPERDSFSDRYEQAPEYESGVVSIVRRFLESRVEACEGAGIDRSNILLDPGLGFGKTVDQNLELIRETPELVALGLPVLSGLSRKSFVGRVSLPERETSDPSERLAGTLALSTAHLYAGAMVFRVHDVSETRQALNAGWAALQSTHKDTN